MSGSRKLLLLGLDAASPPLLKAWAADGTLPNIARLMATGLVGETRNVAAFEGATWPSFASGLNPGRHGFYWQEQLRSGTYRTQQCAPADFSSGKKLWEVLSDAGHRVVVLDVPLSKGAPDLNGAQIVEWGGHDRVFGFHTVPRGLRRTLLDSVGPYPVPSRCDTTRRSLLEYREFADRLIRGTTLGLRLAHKLLIGQPWDFAIQVFGESHCAGHQLWHYHDTAHPGFDPETSKASGNLVREVYVALDTAVGEVIAGLDPETAVVLLSLHGMSRTFGASFLLPEILMRLGVMRRASAELPPGSGTAERLTQSLRAAYGQVAEGIRRPMYDFRQRINQQWLRRGSPINIDPLRSKCFDIHVGRAYSGIRLNLKGREPKGMLAPGNAAERFIEELSHDLLELTRPETGQGLVRAILRPAELFQGPHVDVFPDLVVEWDPAIAIGTAVAGTGGGALVKVWSAKLGLVEGTNTYCRTGDHLGEGMFIALGKGITPGKLGRVVSNLDLAPSFARMMGCDMPGVDGKPIPELFEPRGG